MMRTLTKRTRQLIRRRLICQRRKTRQRQRRSKFRANLRKKVPRIDPQVRRVIEDLRSEGFKPAPASDRTERGRRLRSFIDEVMELSGKDLSEFLARCSQLVKSGYADVNVERDEDDALPNQVDYQQCSPAAVVTTHRYLTLNLSVRNKTDFFALAAKLDSEHNLKGTPNCCLHYSVGNEYSSLLGELWCLSCWNLSDVDGTDTVKNIPLLCRDCK